MATPNTPSPEAAPQPRGMYDPARRRRTVRKGRERGCWLFVPAAELAKAGFQPDEPPPFYRVWGSRKGGLVARLYREA